MINEDIVKEKISLMARDLERLKTLSSTSFKEEEHFIKYSALKNILMEVIGRAVDINFHLVSEHITPEKEAPKTYKEVFLRLQDVGVLPAEFANEIAQTVGIRTAIVHEYNNLEEEDIQKVVEAVIEQYARYCKYVMLFIDRSK